VAIKMLFHPREPRKFLGITFQGIFPKRQQQFAEKLGFANFRELILAEWQKYFTDAQAPFNWAPVVAEVSVSHGLGYTEGPVKTADGTTIVTFYSTWKHTGDGWKVVFDNGYDVCDCRQQP